MTKGALEGVKVVEFGHFLLVPTATAMLADWGAEVIKVENFKRGGDAVRFATPIEGVMPPSELKQSMWFHYFNRNKKSIGIDTKSEKGKKALFRLIERADVFATNFDVGAIEKQGLDYDSLKKINPRLIYCQGSGYGTKGRDKYKPGFDYAAWWARSGMMDRISTEEDPRPQRAGLGDNQVAPAIAGGIAAALYSREKTGQGQKVEVNLYHYAVFGAAFDIGAALNVGVNIPRTNRTKVTNALWNVYKAKDGKWIMFVMPQTDLFWDRFCKAIGKPEWEKDERFDTHQKRIEQNMFLIPAMDEIVATKTADEWDQIARDYDIVLGWVQTPLDVAGDQQAWDNGFFQEVSEEGSDYKFKIINSPVTFSETPATIKTLAPELGQNTEEILLEYGFSWEELSAMKEEAVII